MEPAAPPRIVARLREKVAGARTRAERLRALEALVSAAPDDAPARYELGRELSHEGDADARALEQYRRALAIDSRLARARLGMGIIYHRRGELDAAEGMYRSALASKPRLLKARLNLALVAEQRGDHATAEATYREAIRHSPRSAEARHGRATALCALGRGAEAVGEWEQALAIDPRHAPSLSGLARALAEAGDPRAGDFYARAVSAQPESTRLRCRYARWLADNDRPGGAEEVLRAGLRSAPGSLWLWQALVDVLCEQGLCEEAVSSLREALGGAGAGPDLRVLLARLLCRLDRFEEAARELRPLVLADPANAELRRLLAVIHACGGRAEEAATGALEALRLEPECAWPRLLLLSVPGRPDTPTHELLSGRVHVLPTARAYALALNGLLALAQGRLDAAAKLLEQALQTAPEAALPRVGRGLIHLAEGENEAAYAELRTAAILQPNDFHVQHLAGEAAFHTRRYEEASRAFHTALALGETASFLRAFTFYCRARTFRKLGRTREAVQCYLEAQRLNPDYAASYYGSAVALQESGRREEALAQYQQCLRAAPQHARALMGLATCLEVLGRPREAVDAYRAAVEADSEYPPPRYNLAVLLERTGDPEEIAALLRGYLRLAPDAPNAADARRRLNLAELRAAGVAVGASPTELPSVESTPFVDTSDEGETLSSFAPPRPREGRS